MDQAHLLGTLPNSMAVLAKPCHTIACEAPLWSQLPSGSQPLQRRPLLPLILTYTLGRRPPGSGYFLFLGRSTLDECVCASLRSDPARSIDLDLI